MSKRLDNAARSSCSICRHVTECMPAPAEATTDMPTDGDRAAANGVTARWVIFARQGQPDETGLPAWPADAKSRSALLESGDQRLLRPNFTRHRLNALIAAGNLLER